MRSARSRNSGAGGLCAVRMALTPSLRSAVSRRSQTASGTAVPTAPPSVCRATPWTLWCTPLRKKPWSASKWNSRMPKGTASSSTGLPSRSSVAWTVYIAPWPMSQRSGLAMVVSAFRSAVAPGARSQRLRRAAPALPARTVAAVRPRSAARRSESFAAAADSLVTVLRTWMVAESAETAGVVTNVPQGTMCVSPVVTRRTWRLMPAPGYQRDAGCCESSTRTAITFLPALQVRRQLVDEAHIAVGPVAQQLAIQIDIAVGHHAVEDDEGAARGSRLGIRRGNREASCGTSRCRWA